MRPASVVHFVIAAPPAAGPTFGGADTFWDPLRGAVVDEIVKDCGRQNRLLSQQVVC